MGIDEEHIIVEQSGERRIIVVNSATSLDESNRNEVVVFGSHCGLNVGEYVANLRVHGVIGNDAGKGKDNAGVAGLKVLERHGISAAAVSTMSARIGDGMSTYEEGVISVANEVAKGLGITSGMLAKEAAHKIFEQ